MRTQLLAVSLFGALLAATPAVVAQMPGAADPSRVTAGTYKVDPAHTQVTWKVNHLGFSMLQGQFGASDGMLMLDPKNPAAAKVEITFDMNKLSTTSEQFGTHLRSKDFFDVAANPTARFESTSIQMGPNNSATINGNLTIKGMTKPVTLKAMLVGAGNNPMNKQLNVGFHATAQVKRTDFGLGMAAPMVSDNVDLDINAAFNKAA